MGLNEFSKIKIDFFSSYAQYSIIPWPRPGFARHVSKESNSEIMRNQLCAPSMSRQGGLTCKALVP